MDEENRLKITTWLDGRDPRMDGWLDEDNCKKPRRVCRKGSAVLHRLPPGLEGTPRYLFPRPGGPHCGEYAGGQREPAAHFAVQAVRGGEHDGATPWPRTLRSGPVNRRELQTYAVDEVLRTSREDPG